MTQQQTIPEMISNSITNTRALVERETAEIVRLERELARAKHRLASSEAELERAKAFYETYYGQPYDGWY